MEIRTLRFTTDTARIPQQRPFQSDTAGLFKLRNQFGSCAEETLATGKPPASGRVACEWQVKLGDTNCYLPSRYARPTLMLLMLGS